VREVGYGGASARAIAAKGGFNQALIFYHFGGTDEALLAALDQSTEQRLARYRELMDGVAALPQMVEAARLLFKEDFDTGHVKLLAELVAAGASNPELGKQVAARVAPSLAFSAETFDRLMAGSPLASLVGSKDAAYALSALYLGMELLANLDGSLESADALFASAGRMASLLGMLMPAAKT
jgi:AcrR family transcriptional regulator